MQTLTGQLPTFLTNSNNFGNITANVFDVVNVGAGGPGLTSGGQLLLPIPSQPTQARPWTIYGWGVALTITLIHQPNAWKQPYGKLGKILAGPLFDIGSIANPRSARTLFAAPDSAALPNLATIWDGTQDSSPPFWTGGDPPVGGQISQSSQLPQALTLRQGEQIGFGLWLTPALTGVATVITGATYNVTYAVGR